MEVCSAWGAPLPGGEVEPIGLAFPVANPPRYPPRDRLPSKGSAWFHIRNRLRSRKLATATLQQLLAPSFEAPVRVPNKFRSLLPLPTQRDYFRDSLSLVERVECVKRRRVRRRVHKCQRDVLEGAKLLVALAPKLKYQLRAEFDRLNPQWGALFHKKPRELSDLTKRSSAEILASISITINTRRVLRRRCRGVTPSRLAFTYSQSCFDGSYFSHTFNVHRDITSAVIHELFEEHGFIFDANDIRNPPVLEEEGVWRQ